MKIPPLLIVVSAMISLSLSACNMHKEDEEAHREHHKIVLTSPQAKEVTITKEYVCQINAQYHIDLSARAFGVLEEIQVKEGQAVKTGDVLFRVAPSLYQAKLDAELAKLKRAELEYNNTKRLAEDRIKVVSDQEVAIYQASYKEAQSNVQKAEAELNFATVRAPFDGIIDRQEKQKGSTIKEGEILTTLSDTSVMRVYFNLPEVRYLEYKTRYLEPKAGAGYDDKEDLQARVEALLAELNRRERVELVLTNGSKFPQPGRFAAISSKCNNETGNFTFRADFPNPDGMLRHGQSGKVLIHRNLKNAIVIPQRATYEILEKRYVYVVGKDDVVHQREIVVQHELEDIFVIKSGLTVDDKIVLDGVRQVRDGEKVEYEFHPPEKVLANQKHDAE